MTRHPDKGVYWYEEDRNNGPFIVRVGGTSEFVSEIDPLDMRSSPPGRVEIVEGWENPSALVLDTMDEAIEAAIKVWNIEGFHVHVERVL